MVKNTANATAQRYPIEREASKTTALCPHAPESPDLTLSDSRLLAKVKATTRGSWFESIWDTKDIVTKHTLEERFQSCCRKWQESWGVSEVRRRILKGIDGRLSFIIIKIFF